MKRLRHANGSTFIDRPGARTGLGPESSSTGGLVSAGVAIDAAAVKGINALPLSEIKSTFPVLKNPANKKRAVPITEKQFNYDVVPGRRHSVKQCLRRLDRTRS